jgi:hypothetical protein
MRLLPLTLAAALAAPALAQEALPPPPPPPTQDVPLPPPPPGTSLRPTADLRTPPPRQPGTIGEAPVAPAGSQAAPLHPDESVSHWRYSLATGVAGKFGGLQLSSRRENPGVLLYFAGQADGLWTEGHGQAARVRLRMFSGGEDEVYVPSDGDVEAAYMIGRREFRFVIARLEVGRYPALGIQALAQFATLPCFEGSLALAGDTMRLYYYLSPVEASWVRYYGGAHIGSGDRSAARALGGDWPSESARPVAASAGRLRYTVLLPPSILLSLQGDLMKMWDKADLLVSTEGSLGYQVLDQSAVFNVAVRWNGYTRRGTDLETKKSESEVLLLGIASLVF